MLNNRIWSPSQLRRQSKVSEQSFLRWFLSFILLRIFLKKIQFVSSYGVQRASPVAQCLKIHRQCRRLEFSSWVRKDPLEEERAAHAGVLPWRILWTVKPGGLQSTGLQSVRHDWSGWANTAVSYILNVYVHESVFQIEFKNKYA